MLIVKDIYGNSLPLIDIDKFERKRGINGDYEATLVIRKTERNKQAFDLIETESILTHGKNSYRIKLLDKETLSKGIIRIEATAWNIFYDSIDNYQHKIIKKEKVLSVEQAVRHALEGTGHTFQVDDVFTGVSFENFGDGNSTALFDEAKVKFGFEYTIENKHLTIVKQIGKNDENNNKQMRYKHNIKAITVEDNTHNLSTYIKGYGKPEEDDEGNPIDDEYIIKGDYTSPNVEKYGIREANPYYNEKVTHLPTLERLLKGKIQDEPELSFQIEYAELISNTDTNFDKTDLGDTIYLIHEPMKLQFKIRVAEVIDYPLHPHKQPIYTMSTHPIDMLGDDKNASSIKNKEDINKEIGIIQNQQLNTDNDIYDILQTVDGVNQAMKKIDEELERLENEVKQEVDQAIEDSSIPSQPEEPIPVPTSGLWIDTSYNPPKMKRWNGFEWVILGTNEEEIDNIINQMTNESTRVSKEYTDQEIEAIANTLRDLINNQIGDIDDKIEILEAISNALKKRVEATEEYINNLEIQIGNDKTQISEDIKDLRDKSTSLIDKTINIDLEIANQKKKVEDIFIDLKDKADIEYVDSSVSLKVDREKYNSERQEIINDLLDKADIGFVNGQLVGKVNQKDYDLERQAILDDLLNKVDADYVDGELIGNQINYDKKIADISKELAGKTDLEYVDGQLTGKANQEDVYNKIDVDNELKKHITKISYKTDQDGVVDRLEKNEASITTQADEIASKVSQEEFDLVDGRVSGAESLITQQAGQIASKVAQTEYNKNQKDVIEKLVAAESSITQNARDIESKVSQTDYDTDINDVETGLKGKITKAESSITQQAGQIASKVEQTEFDKVEGRVKGAESSIVQNAGKIESKVEQAEFDIVDSRVGKTESSITQQANEIKSKVSQTEFDEVEGRVSNAESSIIQNNDLIKSEVRETNIRIDNIDIKGTNFITHIPNNWCQGGINSTGKDVVDLNRIRIKEYLSVDGGKDHTLTSYDNYEVTLREYDINNNFISVEPVVIANANDYISFKTQLNTRYIRVDLKDVGGKPVNPDMISVDIKIKLSLGDDTSGWTPHLNDTGELVASVQEYVSDFEQTSTQIKSDVSSLESSLGDTKNDVTAMQGVLDIQSDEISARVTKEDYTEDKEGILGRLTSNEGAIVTNSDNINARVEQSEYDAFTGVVTEDFADLNIKYDEISSTVSNVQVGGRNLIVRFDEHKDKELNELDEMINVVGFAVMRKKIKVKPNSELHFSQDEDNRDRWRFNWYDKNEKNIGSETSRNSSFTKKVPSNAHYIWVSYPMESYAQLERGNKATDWTPAIEDTNERISSAESNITQNADKIEAKISKVDYDLDQDDIISDISNNESRITQTEKDIVSKVDKTIYKKDKEGSDSLLEAHNTSIEQNAQAITNKAESTYVDSEIGKVDTKVSEVVQTAEEISTKVGTLETEQTALGTKVGKHESTITQNAKDIGLKLDSTKYTTDQKGIKKNISDNTASITANAKEIALKVAQEEFNLVEDRVTSSEAGIVANSTAIKLKASQEDLKKKVDTDIYTNKVGALTTSINGVKATADSTKTIVDKQTGDITALEKDTADFNVRAGAIESNVTSITDDVNGISENIGSMVIESDRIAAEVTKVEKDLNGRITDNSSAITQTAEEINQRITSVENTYTEDKKEIISDIKKNESAINATSEQIKLNVTKEELQEGIDSIGIDGVNKRIAKSESLININSESIKLKASQEEVVKKVDTDTYNEKNAQIDTRIDGINQTVKDTSTKVNAHTGLIESARVDIAESKQTARGFDRKIESLEENDKLTSQRFTQVEETTSGISQKVSSIEIETDDIGKRMTASETAINQTPININLAVKEGVKGLTKDTSVISSINLSKEKIKIVAPMIDMIGLVKFINTDGSTGTAIQGGKIVTRSITTNQLDVNQIFANSAVIGKIQSDSIATANLSASKIVSGVLNAGKVDVINLSASKIITGTLDAKKVTVKNIDAGLINTGILNAERIRVGKGTLFEDGYDTSKVKIGARNFLLNSDSFNGEEDAEWSKGNGLIHEDRYSYQNFTQTGTNTSPHSYFWDSANSKFSIALQPNTEYTISLDVRTNSNQYRAGFRQDPSGIGSYYPYINTPVKDEWFRHEYTFTTGDIISEKFLWLVGMKDLKTYIDVRNWQLEKGNKATDWKPAPEDVTNDYNSSINDSEDRVTDSIDGVSDSVDDIHENIHNIEDDLKSFKESYESEIVGIENGIGITFDEIKSIINGVEEEQAEEFNKIRKYINFQSGNIVLGDTASDFKVVISNTKISFMQSSKEVAYISNKKLYITDAEINDSMTIGEFKYTPRSNGSLDFSKI